MSDEDLANVMGFSGFGRPKTARKFDVEAMFQESRQTARDYSSQIKAKQQQEPEDDDEEEIGPPVPIDLSAQQQEDEEGSGDDMEEQDEEFDKRFPLSEAVTLQHGFKPVSALALDPAGARLITGCYGYEVKFWDFAGMDSTLQSFRCLTPCESHPICSIQYSHTGEMVLVASGNAQAVVLDRDGQTLFECPKGWQYIADMTNTNGHISMINNACWHPFTREHFITCSNDCTIRLWDVSQEDKKQVAVIKSRTKQGKKSAITTCAYSKDGKYIAGALYDGSILMWKANGPYVRPSLYNYNSHEPNTETSSLCFAHDNYTLISRGGDHTLKLWDIRNFKSPVHSVSNLFNHYSVTDCTFNPDEQMIITGTSVSIKDKSDKGKLMFFDRSLKEVHQITVSDMSVIRCLWHPKLNQIFVGCGDGNVKLYFSDKHSQRGAKMCIGKRKGAKLDGITSVGPRILTPHALPMFRDEDTKSLKRKREKERKDPILSHRPDLPVTGKGVGGRVSAGGGSSIGAYMRKITALETAVDKDEDPREALLKYAKMAEDNPIWVNQAYKKTQPVPVFQDVKEGDDDDDD